MQFSSRLLAAASLLSISTTIAAPVSPVLNDAILQQKSVQGTTSIPDSSAFQFTTINGVIAEAPQAAQQPASAASQAAAAPQVAASVASSAKTQASRRPVVASAQSVRPSVASAASVASVAVVQSVASQAAAPSVASPATAPSAAASSAAGDVAISQGPGSSTFWMSNINRQGTIAFGDAGYQLYRDVKSCGAKGDGVTDDTAAINACITQGSRCGQGCDSTTLRIALVYFPAGTYLVSKPIIQLYYTQFVGDAINPPTIKAAPGFQGIAVIDSDPYDNGGSNWYTNQNNFFRQIRNFVIDLTALPMSQGTGIHWQVAQATSLQNIKFNMVRGGGQSNKQQGVFMDNGSGGWMTDLTFDGGNYGMFLGNQQFTTRNLVFSNCNTAIFMNWNWLWTLKSVSVTNCGVGIDMSNSPANQTVGSVILQDSKMVNVPVGVKTAFTQNSIPTTGGTLVLDNVDFSSTATGVQNNDGQVYLTGNRVVQSWVQGKSYTGSQGSRVIGDVAAPAKPASLLKGSSVFERSRPQYESWPASSFVSIKSKGARGDGNTDDTAAIQNAMNSLNANQILYFDHGAYVVTRTINVPKNIKVTGEMWPLIMASGAFFGDQNNPQPVFSVGDTGDVGSAEFTDLIFETKGAAPGAIMIQWNSGASSQGSNGMWDVHVRIGGSAGTGLQSDHCSKNPASTHGPDATCVGAHTLFYATKTSSAYLENCWFWVADHELDLNDHNQIDIYNGRGVRIESQGPMWWYGTASEHNQLYNYQLAGAKDIYMGLIQTETPYMQPNPAAPGPFTPSSAIQDPTFGSNDAGDNMAWGMRILNSENVLVYGAGLYSFFQNYGQACVSGQNCQNHMVSIEGTSNNLSLFGLSTKAAINMVSTSGQGIVAGTGRTVTTVQVPDSENRSNFCATLALWRPF